MEKVPKKKARRGLKKGTLLTLVLILAAGVGAGVWALSRPAVLPDPVRAEDPLLLGGENAEIQALALTTPAGESYPLLRGDDGFYLLGQENVALRSDVVEEMLAFAADLTADSTVVDTAKETVNLGDFGLDPVRARVVVTYADGEKQELRIGNPLSQEDTLTYCMRGGDSHIYTVLSARIEPFFRDAAYLRAFDQPQLRGDLLDRIEISGTLNLSMHYAQTGWQLEAPFAYPVAPAQTDALLEAIEGMGFEACLGRAAKLDLSVYGLTKPALTIRLTQAPTVVTGQTEDGEDVSVPIPETRYILRLGDETGESGVYVLWDGMVYKASNFLLGFWKELTVDALLLRQPVNFLVNNLNQVVVAADGQETVYDVRMVEAVTENNQIATDEYGETLYDAAVRKNGGDTDMDAQAFLSWYQQLAGMGMAGKLPEGYAPAGEPTLTLTLKNDELTRTLAFYPYDALHSALLVDGVGVFYTDNAFVTLAKETP